MFARNRPSWEPHWSVWRSAIWARCESYKFSEQENKLNITFFCKTLTQDYRSDTRGQSGLLWKTRPLQQHFLPLIDVELNACSEWRQEDRTNWGESWNMNDENLHKSALEDIHHCWRWIIQTENQSCVNVKGIKMITHYLFLFYSSSNG